jgi:signal transduction histidine kinase
MLPARDAVGWAMSVVLLAATGPSDRVPLAASLQAAGYDVHETEPKVLTTRTVELHPLLVVLDATGLGANLAPVLTDLRGLPEVPGLPILVLTEPGDGAGALAALAAGADDCLPRDVPNRLLLARVGCLVHLRQLSLHSALTERLAQVGRLVTGIVHEIRGPLSVIGGNAEVMLMCLPPGDPALLWAEPILRTARVLQKRLEHLMAAVRAGPPVLKPVDLTELAAEAVSLFVKGTDPRRSKINVATDFPSELPPVRADAGRILQVLINLLANACEATSEGAQTTIHLGAVVQDAGDGRWIALEVRDDGPGIPEAHLPRLFEPFFTTKPEGSGYGLYLAAEILREHGGRLVASNAPGGGASFVLWLPLAEPGGDEPSAA